jgi:hypothetical protein
VAPETVLLAPGPVRLARSHKGTGRTGRRHEVDIKKVATYVIVVFVMWTIIESPARAAELVGVGFEGISGAARGVGEFMTELVN